MSVTMSEELSSGVSDTGDFSPAAASDTLVKQPYVPPQSLPGYTPPPRTEAYLQTGTQPFQMECEDSDVPVVIPSSDVSSQAEWDQWETSYIPDDMENEPVIPPASQVYADRMEDLGSYGAAPASVLNSRTRRYLARWLDPTTAAVSSEDYPQFWEGLGELMKYDYQDLKNFERASQPTIKLLEVWTQHPEHTVGELWGLLEKLEVYHILETDLRDMIIHDAQIYRERELRTRQSQSAPIQVNEVDTQSLETTDHHAQEFVNITVNEVETGVVELFDAFVCYSYPDLNFVKQMIQHLEGIHGLKLCIHARDLLPGTSKHTVTAKLIEERCKKMLIVLSPEFLKSPECDFQTKFAHALSPGSRSKKLVPVIIHRDTRIPNILRHITVADSTKCELRDWFWRRLAGSLKEKPIIDPLQDLEINIPPDHPELPVVRQPRIDSDTTPDKEKNTSIVNPGMCFPSVPSSGPSSRENTLLKHPTSPPRQALLEASPPGASGLRVFPLNPEEPPPLVITSGKTSKEPSKRKSFTLPFLKKQ